MKTVLTNMMDPVCIRQIQEHLSASTCVDISPCRLDLCPVVALLPDVLKLLLKRNGARQFLNYWGEEIYSASLIHLLLEHLSVQEDCEVLDLASSKWRRMRTHESLPRSSVTLRGVYNHLFGCYSDCAAPSLMTKCKLFISARDKRNVDFKYL